ncbi:Putative_ubiquitin fusion degradation protein [Hexamita inflata]|uniref:Putative_ubiquitin fusion degradation protein n=1 Tax=Hexamita inflata TaxID=28002 RepID=A0ABP1IUQ8_9EUKA
MQLTQTNTNGKSHVGSSITDVEYDINLMIGDNNYFKEQSQLSNEQFNQYINGGNVMFPLFMYQKMIESNIIQRDEDNSNYNNSNYNPVTFMIRSIRTKIFCYCGVEFHLCNKSLIFIPYWIQEYLNCHMGYHVQISNFQLSPCSYIKLLPENMDFFKLNNLQHLLKSSLINISAVITGQWLQIQINVIKNNIRLKFPKQYYIYTFQTINRDLQMNVVKLNQYFDVYASISNNQIYLFNQRKVILQSIPVDFNLYPGSSCMNYCYGKECIFDAKLHNLIYCENHIYVQCYEKILELTEKLTLEYIASIPDLTLSTPAAFYGRVFTMQGKLYAHNYNGSQSYSGMLYVLVDNRFKEVKEMPGSFFCFCDNVYVWDYKGFNLCKLTNELELITIINIIDKENQSCTYMEQWCTYYLYRRRQLFNVEYVNKLIIILEQSSQYKTIFRIIQQLIGGLMY